MHKIQSEAKYCGGGEGLSPQSHISVCTLACTAMQFLGTATSNPYIVLIFLHDVWLHDRNIYHNIYIHIYNSECGRWRGLDREERIGRECHLERAEDVHLCLPECERWYDDQVELFQALSKVALDFDLMTDDKPVAILDQRCNH